ncbi:histidine phosphatase family protein [Actinokineospora fastidiosa]|uniref:Phosphoglycerate mutase n=1 Tax=Actinokineospora fastidiosa TaxID=1816 RepID=A0A918GAP2_9PSEU|nr:histidine phosphatase family protein [Actinokineospora fastidiosa]GGS25860.1 phosphoglycerate mutase [Actinokineospora fastidiosa]
MVLYLLRHGETEWSATGRHTSRTDVPLTEAGEAGARRAGARLKELLDDTPYIISSPRRRATHTAELAGLAIDEVTEDVREWDYGDYEGLTTPQIRETVPGWTVWTHPCPNGETAEEVGERARDVLGRIAATTVIIGHGHFSRVLTAAWIGQPAAFGVRFALAAGAVTVLADERGVPQIRALNLS